MKSRFTNILLASAIALIAVPNTNTMENDNNASGMNNARRLLASDPIKTSLQDIEQAAEDMGGAVACLGHGALLQQQTAKPVTESPVCLSIPGETNPKVALLQSEAAARNCLARFEQNYALRTRTVCEVLAGAPQMVRLRQALEVKFAEEDIKTLCLAHPHNFWLVMHEHQYPHTNCIGIYPEDRILANLMKDHQISPLSKFDYLRTEDGIQAGYNGSVEAQVTVFKQRVLLAQTILDILKERVLTTLCVKSMEEFMDWFENFDDYLMNHSHVEQSLDSQLTQKILKNKKALEYIQARLSGKVNTTLDLKEDGYLRSSLKKFGLKVKQMRKALKSDDNLLSFKTSLNNNFVAFTTPLVEKQSQTGLLVEAINTAKTFFGEVKEALVRAGNVS